MFELLALLAVIVVGGVVIGAVVLALSVVKFAFKLVLAPLFFVLKWVALIAIGATFVAVAAAVIVPIVVVIAVFAIPIALIGALT